VSATHQLHHFNLVILFYFSFYTPPLIGGGILSTLPPSTAEPECVFSKVNKTLSAIRSTMTDDRLEACILLQVHRDLTPEPASMVEHFARTGARRLSFVL